MNETRTGRAGNAASEEEIRRLLHEAGPRSAIPAEDLAAIRKAARTEWETRFGFGSGFGKSRAVRSSGRWWLALAAAAMLGAIGLVLWKGRPPAGTAAIPVASIEVLAGEVDVAAPGEPARRLTAETVGAPLPAGTELRTNGAGAAAVESGRVALRTTGGASLRLDSGSRLRLVSAKLVDLTAGGVYVDSGPDARKGAGVAVRTAAGLFQDQGTQYEVRTEGSGAAAVTRLRVREGRVALRRGEGSALVTDAGYELRVEGNEEPVQSPTDRGGPAWDWVLQTAPMPAIEGMKVRGFLDWLGRETGWKIQFAGPEAAAMADSVVLHGSIRHLTPAQAPSVVLSSAGLDHRVANSVMTVFVPEPDGLKKNQ